MRRKKVLLSHALKTAAKCTIAAVTVFALALQPCFTLPAYALTGNYDREANYPDWDDPDYQYYYWQEDIARKVTNVTRTYSDGTKYTAEYKYNAMGNMTNASIKEADGSKITIKRAFDGEFLISSTLYEYDASDKYELTHLTEYGNAENATHELYTVKYSDKTTASKEIWYYDKYQPLKSIQVDSDGITTQTEYVYNEQGDELSIKITCSDGSESTEEWHYDEKGTTIYYKNYKYDSFQETKYTIESQLEGDADSGTAHSIATTVLEGVGEKREETWQRMKDGEIVKKITTNTDGSQFTEDYFYDLSGSETLYTKTENGLVTERRETVNSSDGKTSTYSDGKGTRVVYGEFYDKISEMHTNEETRTNADGSSSYSKQTYGYSSAYSVDIRRYKAADGTETYNESTVEADGSTTTKVKSEDGTITISKKDTEGSEISKSITLSDGTTAETSMEYTDDGDVISEVTRYSDGSEDRTDYEYDEHGALIKTTESRRNGVKAVMQCQLDTSSNSGTGSITFNNGYISTWSQVKTDENTTQLTTIFSHGEISQYTAVLVNRIAQIKTIYRDGRVDEFSIDFNSDYDSWIIDLERWETIASHNDVFEEEAWTVLPSQTELASQTSTPSDGVSMAEEEHQ